MKFACSTDEDRVSIDQPQLQRVIINMINNAVHAMAGREQGRITVSIDSEMFPSEGSGPWARSLTPGRYLTLKVTDTGQGIPQDVIDRIFEPFFSTKPTGSGTGLGLTIAHKFAENHGGSIGVTSAAGRGTTFFIHLPAEGNVCRQSISVSGKGHSILLVDDDSLVRNTLAEGLRRMGYTLYSAASGQSAITVLEEEKPELSLVITDQIMPGMTGLDLRKKIAEIRPDLPVLLLSGYTTMLDETTARASGFARILMKPITIEQLDLAVRETILLKKTR